MLVSELKALIRQLLGDETNWSPDDTSQVAGQSYSEVQYNQAIDFAIKEYALKKKTTYSESTLDINEDGEVTVSGTNFLIIERVVYGGVELVESTRNFEWLKSPTWIAATSTAPRRWLLLDGATIRLTPKMTDWATPPNTCTVGIVAAPAAVQSDNESLDTRVPKMHQEFLKFAAAGYLLKNATDQQNAAIEQSYMATFNQLIGVA